MLIPSGKDINWWSTGSCFNNSAKTTVQIACDTEAGCLLVHFYIYIEADFLPYGHMINKCSALLNKEVMRLIPCEVF